MNRKQYARWSRWFRTTSACSQSFGRVRAESMLGCRSDACHCVLPLAEVGPRSSADPHGRPGVCWLVCRALCAASAGDHIAPRRMSGSRATRSHNLTVTTRPASRRRWHWRTLTTVHSITGGKVKGPTGVASDASDSDVERMKLSQRVPVNSGNIGKTTIAPPRGPRRGQASCPLASSHRRLLTRLPLDTGHQASHARSVR